MESDSPPSSPPHSPHPLNPLQAHLTQHFTHLISQHSALDIDRVFYLEASKLYIQLVKKAEEVESVQEEVTKLRKELGMEHQQRRRSIVQQLSAGDSNNNSEKRKRARRTAVEIARHYICHIDKCNKSYGSEGSLNQHIKLKHRSHYAQHMLMMDLQPQ